MPVAFWRRTIHIGIESGVKGVPMSLRKRIFVTAVVLIIGAAASFAFAISYDAACPPTDPSSAGATRMQAFVARCYGAPEVLRMAAVERPTPADNEVLIKVRAVSINPLDWHRLRGSPYFLRLSGGFGAPKDARIGGDIAGIVESVGKEVERFQPGDEVFGRGPGGFAQYAVAREDRIALKPPNMTFEQAAAAPVAAITALQALRDKGGLAPGQKVLINGASGGVGTFAVQIGKLMGAEVTGVCSTRNVELVRALGADHVVDYTQQDFTQADEQYDLILDNVGSQGIFELRQVLKPGGRIVIIGATSKDPWIGMMTGPIAAALVSPFVDEEMGMFMGRMDGDDLSYLSSLMHEGKLVPVIDRRYPFAELA
jgi:NADPH:quinone reductase-like Zn-dependent oxidoreductase